MPSQPERRTHTSFSAKLDDKITLLPPGFRPYLFQPRRAASIAAMSIFFMVIIASNARLATAGLGSVIASVRAIGVICQDKPHLSLHQPHALSSPPWPTIAFQLIHIETKYPRCLFYPVYGRTYKNRLVSRCKQMSSG